MSENDIDIEWLKNKFGVKTDAQLAEILNVSVDNIRSWKKREIPKNIKNIFKNKGIIGDNNTQISGKGNIVNIAKQDEYAELLSLIKNYATPKLIEEFKAKLLKIKEIHES